MRTGLGKVGLAISLLLPGLTLSQELKDGWDVVLTQKQFEMGREGFNLISVRPIDVKKLIERTPEAERRKLVWKLYRDRASANQILHIIKRFIYRESVSRGMVQGTNTEKLRTHLQKILSGRFPFSAVTAYYDPWDMYQLFGMGFDFGEGIPLEIRLAGRSMEKLQRPKTTVGPVPICYVDPYGKPECNEEVSDFLSSIPRRHGDIGELRSLTKSKDSPYDFTELLYYTAMAEGWSYWGGTELTDEERPPALTGEMLVKAGILHERFPHIPEELLFPERQQYLFIDDFYAHTLSQSRERLYLQKIGMKLFLPAFDDPDFLGHPAHILHINSQTLKDKTPELLAAHPVHALLQTGVIAHNPMQPMGCAMLIDIRDPQQIRNLRFAKDPGAMRMVDVREFAVPPGSYIRKIALEIFPELKGVNF